MAEKTDKDNKRQERRISAKILVLFGTRSEAIKLAPVILELKKVPEFDVVIVSSGQHFELLLPVLEIFGISVHYDLEVMSEDQTPNRVVARTVNALDVLLADEKPDLILVQGSTSTALAGALSGFNRDIAVGHVEAGLRSGDLRSPFPEEMNRRLITQAATVHFVLTPGHRQNLLREQISDNQIFVVGSTVADSLEYVRGKFEPGKELTTILSETEQLKRVVLTTHRREAFRSRMAKHLKGVKEFVERFPGVCVIFPVHPNPSIRRIVEEAGIDNERFILTEPFNYADFITLLENSWLVLTDSGGILEEAPTLGKPVLILSDKTERREAVMCGIAKLVGNDPELLGELLANNYLADTWVRSVKPVHSPFGDSGSAARIAEILETLSKPAES